MVSIRKSVIDIQLILYNKKITVAVAVSVDPSINDIILHF